jgi:hypothetical protein
MTDTPHDSDAAVVHEAVGPPLSPREAGAAIAIGVVSLLLAGFLSILLGALADEHRLSAQGIGLAAMLEALVLGASTGLCAMALKPERLKLIGVVASLGMAAANLAMLGVHGGGVFVVRGLAGVPEGVLLWITIGMIARTEVPERWAGVLFTALALAQFATAMAFTAWVVPVFHANGGFAAVALISLAGVVAAVYLPSRYAPLPDGGSDGGPPPPRGWIALGGTLIFVSAAAAVGIYVVPLAEQAGLGAGVGRFAVTCSLAAQVLGGALATVAAGRINYFVVFVLGTIASIAVFVVYGLSAPAWLFIGATAFGGIVNIFITPFLVPMTIEADPSRRAAVQSGAAQLFGAALGPLLAAVVVSEKNIHGALYLGAGLLLVGLAIIAGLHFTAKSNNSSSSRP